MKSKKKVMVAIILMFVFAVTVSSNKSMAMSSSVKKACKQKISQTKKSIEFGEYFSYGTVKLKGAKNPILCINKRIASDTYWIELYSYKNGKFKKIASADGSDIKKYKNYLSITYGHSDLTYKTVVYRYKNGKIKKVGYCAKEDDGRHEKLYSIVEKTACKKAGLNWKNFKAIDTNKWKEYYKN